MKERTIRAISYDSAGAGYLYDFSREVHGYDKMSRLRSTDRVEDGKRDAFGYNDAGELTSADYGLQWNGSAYVNPSRAVSYNLDTAGNRDGLMGVNDNGAATGYTPNTLNQYGETTNGTQHEIGGYDGVTYRYLADTYLASVSSTAAGAYELGYDALGRCVKRSTNGQSTYFAFAGDRPIIEYNSSGAITASSVYGLGIDEIIARHNNGQAQFLHQDRLGNTSAVTNIAGEVIEQYRYDAFGTPTIRSGPTPGTGPDPANRLGTLLSASQINNRFLFTGREWVRQFGFYEYRARAYHPGLGRFMSEDPIGFAAGDTNLFRYCGGDPVNRTDPSGLAQSHPPPLLRDTSLGGNPFSAFPQGQGISTAGWWGGKPGGNDFYSGFVGRSGGRDGGGGGSAPSGRNPDGTPILRAQPVSNTIGVMGVNGTNAPGNQALIQFLRGVGTVVYRDYLSTVVQGLANSGYNSATLLGYSRGGVVAINQMGAFSSFTFNFVGIDVVRFGRGDLELPSNVVSATNFYQQNPHNYFDLRGNPFIGTRLTSDTIAVNNNNWTGGPYSGINHNNVVRAVDAYYSGGGN